jgi:hypothetical protein
MILKVGKYGIKKIKNSNTSSGRSMMAVYKGMDLTGGLHISKDTTIHIGYNEEIEMDSPEQAEALFVIIHAVLVKGEEAENVLNNMIEMAQTLFFQEVA